MKTKKKKTKAKARVTKPKARVKAKAKKKVVTKKKAVAKKKIKAVAKVKKVKPKAKAKKRKGFTLIEMLIVVAIIGVLATVVLVAVTNARKKSNATQAKALVQQISTAYEMYKANGCQGNVVPSWPASAGDPLVDCNGEVLIQRVPVGGNNFGTDVQKYLSGGLTYGSTGSTPNDLVVYISGFHNYDTGTNNGIFTCSQGSCSCNDPSRLGCTRSE